MLTTALFKGRYESFTIIVENLGLKRADFGLAIGRIFLDLPGDRPYFYIFNTHRIEARAYAWQTANPFRHREQRQPNTFWETGELASMEIRFDSGRFQWFAGDEKRAEFEAPKFLPIEIIGFLIQSTGVRG